MGLSFVKVPVKKSNGLRKILHQHLCGTEVGRSFKNLHASDVTYGEYQFCARERAYQESLNKKPPIHFLSTAENVTFDIGRFVEEKVIDTFVEAGIAVGDWKCKHCGSMFKFCKRPPVCKHCGHKHFKHVEQRVLSDKTGISCGIDLLLNLPGAPKHRVVEIKSIDKDQFKSLVAPLGEHEQRTKLYLKCLAESSQDWCNLVQKDWAYVLYVSKGGYGTQCEEVAMWNFHDSPFSPFKDYVVERDDASLKKVLEQPLNLMKWKQAQLAGENPPLPPRLCSSSLDKRAKKCSCLNPCFLKQATEG